MTVPEVLENLQPLLEEFRAAAVDTDGSGRLPRRHLEALGQAGVFRLAVPVEKGGLAAPAEVLWEVSDSLAAACGTTNFGQAQHQGAIGFLVRSQNEGLVSEVLPDYLDGSRLCGVAFAHLRRPTSPLHVQRDDHRFVLVGEAPWFTGWGLMDDVVLAGRDDDGQDIYMLAPLRDPSVQATTPLALAAINSSATVSLHISELGLAEGRWVLTQTLEEMARRDFKSQLGYSSLALGLVREACRLIDEARADHAVVEHLQAEAAQLRRRALAWNEDREEALNVRCLSNHLGLRAAQAAVVAVGGRANQLHHPAGRLLREASFYFLTQLNEPLRQVALERLGRP